MPTYTVHDGGSAGPLIDALAELYAIVYAEPPYCEGPEQVARFREGLPDEATRPGFTLAAAHDRDRLVGAAYGWTMPAGTWWSRADGEPPADVREAAKLAVMEWIVHPARRSEGIGAELMRRLLADRPERYATLASDPRSHARQVYARNGWRQVGTSALPWGPPMDLLVLDLGREPVQGG
ncbi:GNAT family N-acetyltransferase [Micromonospora krabiensis]|uniref:Acetyltransferase (GNAT) family protein n=1 Tax=Micromonospora krabiensis TaxID=307121 RepID=A0A1C3NEA5_9ACTN|nr:GNAT family N-acetyltransferase [Micromonospora krabiensis]SBV30932.1 Acetyltransferase (GNAT) family protein [Micromonospora krabiensis]